MLRIAQNNNSIIYNSIILIIFTQMHEEQPKASQPPASTHASTSTFHHSKPIAKPQRITQLQCLSSNSQLQLFFIQGINQSFKYLPNLLSHIYNEIQLIVGIAQFRLTIAIDKPHPGDQLQNIMYIQKAMTKNVKLLYLLFTVILPYLKNKLVTYLTHNNNNNNNREGWKQKLLYILNWVDKILLALHIINFSIFIKDGIYRNLVQRILKIPMKFISGESGRILDFTLMNRRLIWHVYQLFLKTVFPYLHNLFGNTLKNIFYLNSYLNTQSQSKMNCTMCGDKAKLPMKANCGHLACYYCYSVNRNVEREYKCKECNQSVREWKKLF